MYNSTTITVPTFCQGTTGAYCTTLDIAKPLVSDGSIFINCNETTIGSEDEKAVLCSMNGDININATKANKILPPKSIAATAIASTITPLISLVINNLNTTKSSVTF